MQKIFRNKSLFTVILSILTLFFIFSISSNDVEAKNSEKQKHLSKEELLENNVNPKKVDSLIKKMDSGNELDSDLYLKKHKKLKLASSDDSDFRIDFPDGSFIENKIEDVTVSEDSDSNTGIIRPLGITQVGGTQENRTLKISHTAPWGYQSWNVKIYFPLGGYGKILQAYNWYVIGATYDVIYQGIYRASETASNDAVAMNKLTISLAGYVGFTAKLEFRIRDGRYWTVYSS